jgi:hypothetical protein
MATLLVKDVPDELYTAFSKLAYKKGSLLKKLLLRHSGKVLTYSRRKSN